MGQRNLFFPEIKSHSKSRDMNHSYLRISQHDEEKIAGKFSHINTRNGMHKFHQGLTVLLNLSGGFPVSHWDKARERWRRIGGDGGYNWCVGDKECYLTGPYILCMVPVQSLVRDHQNVCSIDVFRARNHFINKFSTDSVDNIRKYIVKWKWRVHFSKFSFTKLAGTLSWSVRYPRDVFCLVSAVYRCTAVGWSVPQISQKPRSR